MLGILLLSYAFASIVIIKPEIVPIKFDLTFIKDGEISSGSIYEPDGQIDENDLWKLGNISDVKLDGKDLILNETTGDYYINDIGVKG